MDSTKSSGSCESKDDLAASMQQVAIEKDVMESANDVNPHKAGNLKITSDDSFPDQEIITDEYDNRGDDDSEANSKPRKFKKICHIDRLPAEILEMIFYRFLSPSDRKKIRLVSRTWYYRSNRNENVVILSSLSTRRARPNFLYLNNCGLENMNLKLYEMNYNKNSIPLWGNIGEKIRSLSLSFCRLRDRAFADIILHCNNLEFLKIDLLQNDRYDRAADFCTPSTLESLDCIRPKLKMLKIKNGVPFYVGENDCYFKIWERIFNRLVHIFPNVIHYGVESRSNSRCKRSKFKFSLQSSEIGNRSDLVSILANAICVQRDNFSWRNALDTLSTLRLTAVSLELSIETYTEEDRITIFKFFTCQRILKFIELNLYNGLSEPNGVYKEIVASLIFHLLELNPDLRTLRYCKCVNWILLLSCSEFLRFCSVMQLPKTLITDELIIENSSMLSSGSSPNLSLKMLSFSSYFYNLEHLSLQCCTDEILQIICQYMTNLKTLKIVVREYLSNFGITGRKMNSYVGYSINRLKNLERLELNPYKMERVDDEIFNEFDFPKLNHLSCFVPKKQGFQTLVCLGQKIPLLSEIVFVRSLLPYDGWSQRARSEVELSSSKLKNLFVIFPMLKSISLANRKKYSFLFEERSREVIFRESNERNSRRFRNNP